jgi:hypothetical protein
MDAELFKPFEFIFKVLKKLGLWQDGNQTWRYFYCGYTFHFICVYTFFIFLFIYGLNAENFIDIVEPFGVGIAVFTLMLKSIIFFVNVRGFGKFLDNLNELLDFSADKTFADRARIRKEVNFAFNVFRGLSTTAVTTLASAILIPFFAHQLPYKAWFPFTTEYGTIGFWIGSFYMLIFSFPIGALDMIFSILPVISMSFAIGLLNELAERLSEIGKAVKLIEAGPGQSKEKLIKPSSKQIKEELIKCIEIHMKIKKYVKEIEENFSLTIFIQGIMSSVILCFCTFTMSTVRIVISFFY